MPREPKMKKAKITTAGTKIGGMGGRDGNYKPVASRVRIGGKVVNAPKAKAKAKAKTTPSGRGTKTTARRTVGMSRPSAKPTTRTIGNSRPSAKAKSYSGRGKYSGATANRVANSRPSAKASKPISGGPKRRGSVKPSMKTKLLRRVAPSIHSRGGKR